MRVEVSLFIGGSVIKEVVVVERFDDAEKVAIARNPFGRVVNRKILYCTYITCNCISAYIVIHTIIYIFIE